MPGTRKITKKKRPQRPKTETGAGEIGQVARGYGRKAIEKLWEIATQAQSESVRIAALKALLERGYGKDRHMTAEASAIVLRRIERIIVDPKN